MLTLALLIYALSPTWLLMVAAGTLLGLGVGLIDAGINTYIVQNSRTAHLIGFLHGFYGVGTLSGPLIATTLLAWGLNWRQVYGVFAGVVSLLMISILGAIICRYLPLNQRISESKAPAWKNLRRSLQTPTVLLTGLLLLVYVGLEVSIGTWAYSVQTIVRQTPELMAGYNVSTYWVGLTIGRFILGYFLRSLGAIRTISLSLVLLLIGLLLWCQLPNPLISLPLIGFALAAIFPATIWLIPQRLPKTLVPAAVSFATSMASFGAALIPTGVGWMASWTGLGIIPVLMLPLVIIMMGLHYFLVQSSNTSINRSTSS